MHIELRKVGQVIIVDLDGRLVSGVGDVVLGEAMNRIVADGWKYILLNMSQVKRIDSAGIGELMDSVHLAERFECKVHLLNIVGQVHRVLEISQLLPLLKTFGDEQEALETFGPGALKERKGGESDDTPTAEIERD
ncbi:MAG: STAS domain-containing protein [Acidobacteriota bacterium]